MTSTVTLTRSPIPLAEALLETLEQEQAGLVRLRDQCGQQLQALRDQQAAQLQSVTQRIGEETNLLDHLRQVREQQMHRLGHALGGEAGEAFSLEDLAERLRDAAGGAGVSRRLLAARAGVVEEAGRTQQRREELDFAVEYAVKLGREMLHALNDLDVPLPGGLYTADGAAAPGAASRPIVDRQG